MNAGMIVGKERNCFMTIIRESNLLAKLKEAKYIKNGYAIG